MRQLSSWCADELTSSLYALRNRYYELQKLDESPAARTVIIHDLPLQLRDANVLRRYIESRLYFGDGSALRSVATL